MKERIMKEIEAFVRKHLCHSNKFYETVSDVFSNKYYIKCYECGDATYIHVEENEDEEYSDALIEIENKYKIVFCDN